MGEHILEENEQFDKTPYKIRGCTLTMVERLDEEFTKLLKECDPHSNEYVERYGYSNKCVFVLLDNLLHLFSKVKGRKESLLHNR